MSAEESESDNIRGKLSANTDDACADAVKAKADLLEAQKTIAKLDNCIQDHGKTISEQSLELRALKARNQTLEELLNKSAMSVTDNEHRNDLSPLLHPVNTLKHLYRQQLNEEEFKERYMLLNVFFEFRLNGQPESLKAFTDLFDGFPRPPIVWITKNAFVCCDKECRFHCGYEEVRFLLHFNHFNLHHNLSIHDSTLEEAIVCLDYLVGLKDTHFRAMHLTYSTTFTGVDSVYLVITFWRRFFKTQRNESYSTE
jgi:hypothetical protein